MSRANRPEIAIVGSGFGMLAVLDSLIAHQISGFSIAIYSKDHDQIGEAYRQGPDVFLMNTKTSALKPFDHILPLEDWLQSDQSRPLSQHGYIPRSMFGAYLKDVSDVLISRLLELDNLLLRRGEVDHIATGSKVVLTDGQSYNSALIFLSMGFGASIDLNQVYNCLEAAPFGGTVDIIGSGLSGIDLVLLTARARPDLAIRCLSRSGRFPRVRSDFLAGGASLLESDTRHLPWSFGKVFTALRSSCRDSDDQDFFEGRFSHHHELAYARENVSGWQSALYNSTRHYADAFMQFTPRDKHRAFGKRSEFLQRRVMYPITTGEKLGTLLDTSQLTMHRQALSEAQAPTSQIRAYNRPDALYRFAMKSGLAIDEFGCVSSDIDGCVCSERLIYALGPMTNGIRYFTEASSLTKAHAGLAVRSAVSRLGIQHGQIAKWAS